MTTDDCTQMQRHLEVISMFVHRQHSDISMLRKLLHKAQDRIQDWEIDYKLPAALYIDKLHISLDDRELCRHV